MQLFGNIGLVQGNANAMLCLDSDRPHEAIISWFGEGVPPGAMLVDASRDEATWQLVPKRLYRVNDGGGLIEDPLLRPEEREALAGLNAFGTYDETHIKGEWRDSQGGGGTMLFHGPSIAPLKRNEITVDSWEAFKGWASRARRDGFSWFRGHGDCRFSLSTTLHRAGRYRLERYCNEHLVQFVSHAETVLKTRFSLSDLDDYSTILGLAQHHGLPTPMLDWTESPYVAAFFAFTDALENAANREASTHVRIYGLSQGFVERTSPNVIVLPRPDPYVASLSITARHNPRLYAQQGRFLVTNVGDLERYIYLIEELEAATFLTSVRVPVAYAVEAIDDLRFMGLTAANLFPGLDGVCRMLKHSMRAHLSPLGPHVSCLFKE